MKKLIQLFLFCTVLAMLPLQNTKAENNASKFFSIGLNLSNGTGDNGSIYLYGPTPVSAYFGPSGGSYGPLTAGTYTINIYTAAPGSRTFRFNGQAITTSTGSATFNNVSITSTAFASVN
jgi:hypothetical protein